MDTGNRLVVATCGAVGKMGDRGPKVPASRNKIKKSQGIMYSVQSEGRDTVLHTGELLRESISNALVTRKGQSLGLVTDANPSDGGDHFTIYATIASLGSAPETNIM